jgi:hypothetical protein
VSSVTQDSDSPDTDDPKVALEAVEAAIRHWIGVRRGSKVLLTGWVLHYGTTSIDDEGDPGYQVQYAVSETTDLVRAVGVSDLGHRMMLADILGDPS